MANKDKYLRVRIDEREYKGIVRRSALKDLTLSEYIRRMIDKGERCTCKGQGIVDKRINSTGHLDLDW